MIKNLLLKKPGIPKPTYMTSPNTSTNLRSSSSSPPNLQLTQKYRPALTHHLRSCINHIISRRGGQYLISYRRSLGARLKRETKEPRAYGPAACAHTCTYSWVRADRTMERDRTKRARDFAPGRAAILAPFRSAAAAAVQIILLHGVSTER